MSTEDYLCEAAPTAFSGTFCTDAFERFFDSGGIVFLSILF
ncbi:hypothetical protein Y888_11675 [Mixta calida B021323]|nr:hypothetical protein Y888_11675 [Mixta calida B021323]